MAGLIPAIHVVKLANGQTLSRTKTLRCGWTTWMAGTRPRMRGGRRHVTVSIHQGRPKAGAELALHSRLRVGGKNRPSIRLHYLRHFGAGEGIRTLDPNLGKVVLYP